MVAGIAILLVAAWCAIGLYVSVGIGRVAGREAPKPKRDE